MTETPTQPIPEHIARAADTLEALLLGSLGIEQQLAVGAALATLVDVIPPYPPPAPITEPITHATGIPLVLDELRAAIDDARGVQEAVRVGLAAVELRRLR